MPLLLSSKITLFIETFIVYKNSINNYNILNFYFTFTQRVCVLESGIYLYKNWEDQRESWLKRLYPEMRELKAKARKSKKDIAMEALAISVKSSFPQFETQSSTRVTAAVDADISRYAIT